KEMTDKITSVRSKLVFQSQDQTVTDQNSATLEPTAHMFLQTKWISSHSGELIRSEEKHSNGTWNPEAVLPLRSSGQDGLSAFPSSDLSLPEVCISTNSNSFEDDMNYEVQQAYKIFTSFLSEKHKGITGTFLHPIGHHDSQHGIEGVHGQVHSQLRQSMCMRRIEEKFVNQEYENITEFVADFRLMLENCYRYYGVDHWISKQAQKLEIMLEQKLTLLSRVLREKTSLAVTSKGRFGAEEERGSGGTSTRRRQASRYLATITVGTLWELPAIGHFLCLAQTALNLPEIVFFELERCLLMPRCSLLLSKVMSSLLSPPQRRATLQRRPALPYRRWESELRQRVMGWYRAVGASHNQPRRAEQLGLCHQFFNILGEVSPLEEKPFHLLPFYQRVWLLKGLCDHVYETQKDVQDAVLAQPIHECRESILGYDSKENAYIHFPHFCGADLRVYCQSPSAPPAFPFPSLLVRRVEMKPGTEGFGSGSDGVRSETDQNDSHDGVQMDSEESGDFEKKTIGTLVVFKRENGNREEEKSRFQSLSMMDVSQSESSDGDSGEDSKLDVKKHTNSLILTQDRHVGGDDVKVNLKEEHSDEEQSSEQEQVFSFDSEHVVKAETQDPSLNVSEHSYTGRSPSSPVKLGVRMEDATSTRGHQTSPCLDCLKRNICETKPLEDAHCCGTSRPATHLSSETPRNLGEERTDNKIWTKKKKQKKKRARELLPGLKRDHKHPQHGDSLRPPPTEAAKSVVRKVSTTIKRKDKTKKYKTGNPAPSGSSFLQQGARSSARLKGPQVCTVKTSTLKGGLPTPSTVTAATRAAVADTAKLTEPKQELKTVCIRDSQSILVTTRGGNTGIVKVQTSSEQNSLGSFSTSPVITISPQLKAFLVSKTSTALAAPIPSQASRPTVQGGTSTSAAQTQNHGPLALPASHVATNSTPTTVTSITPVRGLASKTTRTAAPLGQGSSNSPVSVVTNISQLVNTATYSSPFPSSTLKNTVVVPSLSSGVSKVPTQEAISKNGVKRSSTDEISQVTKYILVTSSSSASSNQPTSKRTPSSSQSAASSKVVLVSQPAVTTSTTFMGAIPKQMMGVGIGQALTTPLSNPTPKMGISPAKPVACVRSEASSKASNSTLQAGRFS
ncbi:hypothetical protein GOODEAATRI_000124, partial [Goodea atripinnis]